MIPVRLSDEAWGDVEAEALVNRWAVSEGARVRAGDLLAEVVLVKTTMEIVAPVDGVVSKILVPEQDTFARGQDLAILEEAPSAG